MFCTPLDQRVRVGTAGPLASSFSDGAGSFDPRLFLDLRLWTMTSEMAPGEARAPNSGTAPQGVEHWKQHVLFRHARAEKR